MGSVNVRKDLGTLYFDFRYKGVRCREQTLLKDTASNRKKMQKVLDRIEEEISLGTFEYARYFPQSRMLAKFSADLPRQPADPLWKESPSPLFEEFAWQWMEEMRIQWRNTQIKTVTNTLTKYLIPRFGESRVGHITKRDIMAFRSDLAKVPGRNGKMLSASRINHILTPLRMILNEAANRYEFTAPYQGIKSLKVPRTIVEPFSLEEVEQILRTVRKDFRNYYLIRFFTGLRTSEIDGLRWEKVDLSRRQILVW